MTEQKNTEYVEVDIDALSWYLTDKDLKEYSKDIPKEQVYTAEIENGNVREVLHENWASWCAVQMSIWKKMIMQFTKPTE